MPKRSNTSKKKCQLRFIEIGWLHKEEDGYKQVRTINGGGTRKVRVPVNYKKQDLLLEGQKLFFPNGECAQGTPLNRFTTTLLDFSQKPINEYITVEQMFSQTKLTRLRVYLSTEKKSKCETVVSGESTTFGLTDDNTLENISFSDSSTLDAITTIEEAAASAIRPLVEDESSDVFIYDYDQLDNVENLLSLPSSNTNSVDRLLAVQLQNDELSVNSLTENSAVTETDSESTSEITITLHRGHIFEELMEVFSEKNITGKIHVKLMLPNGNMEAAEDFGGVWRDALSEFWWSMMEKCTVGTKIRVPHLRHDFGREKWTVIARILKKGWITEKYFPIKISKCFIEYCIHKTLSNNLTADFLEYINNDEKQILTVALSNFRSVDVDELIDVLSNYDCKVLPTEENIAQIVAELANQEIVQKPAYISDCFYDVVKNMLSKADLDNLYNNCKPSSKNILHLMEFEIYTPEHEKVISFLKKYIRDADDNIRMSFLRFTTGSDIPLGQPIKITFSTYKGLERRPIAHTCGNTIEISEHYDNYIEFRSEFNNILNSNIWVMDIV